MTTVADIRLRTYALDQSKISDASIEAAIDDAEAELTYLRKTGVPDNVYDKAVIFQACVLVAQEYVTATAVVSLGFSRNGMDVLVKSLEKSRDLWKTRCCKKFRWTEGETMPTSAKYDDDSLDVWPSIVRI